MTLLAGAVVTAYLAAAIVIAAFVTAQLHLLACTFGARRPPDEPEPAVLPLLTVQLPLYNERRVVGALLDSIAQLDWPRDRLEIQVLDDATDETTAIAADRCARMRQAGLDVVHVRRTERAGFKAGALAHGLALARGELIAIFDADFRPEPDFLRRALTLLAPDVGLVQARWAHPDACHSWLTRLQALQLDHHFTLEQRGRDAGGLLMSFNGTAGLWRRRCIEEAGGWRADSLTEDLDLSYRAQLAGWSLRYDDSFAAPAELPRSMSAVRTQQFRWMKGGAQVARMLLPRLWSSEQPLRRKLQGSVHLLGSSVFLAVLTLCLVGPLLAPVAHLGPAWASAAIGWTGTLLQGVLVALVAVYLATCVRRADTLTDGIVRLVAELPPLLAVSAGMSLHDSIAVVQGWGGRPSPFVRTPKVGDDGDGPAAYLPPPPPLLVWAELGLALWMTLGAVIALALGAWMGALFLANQALGFAVFAGATLAASRGASPVPATS